MFPILIDAVENAIDVVTAPLTGDVPTKRQLAKLIADGLTIYAIAEATGVAVEVLQRILSDDT